MKLSLYGAILLAVSGGQMVFAAPTSTEGEKTNVTTTSTGYIPQKSPIFPDMEAPKQDVVSSYNYGPYNTSDTLPTYKLQGYPEPFKIPDVNHPEVKAAVAQIDWSLVPKAPIRKQDKNGDFKPDTDGDKDPYCWWSDTNCVKPKINIPEDLHSCQKKGDWGLSYDDGPFNIYTDKNAAKENPYAEPALYNFLAKNNNQKADLFVSLLLFPYIVQYLLTLLLSSILVQMLLLILLQLSVLLMMVITSVYIHTVILPLRLSKMNKS